MKQLLTFISLVLLFTACEKDEENGNSGGGGSVSTVAFVNLPDTLMLFEELPMGTVDYQFEISQTLDSSISFSMIENDFFEISQSGELIRAAFIDANTYPNDLFELELNILVQGAQGQGDSRILFVRIDDTTSDVNLLPTLPSASSLFDLVENDVVANNGQAVLGLSGVFDPDGGDLAFSVTPPFVINSSTLTVELASGQTIDADENENASLLSAQNGSIDFTLTVTDDEGESVVQTYTASVQDLVPDWFQPDGSTDNAYGPQGSYGNPYPISEGGQTYTFASRNNDFQDGEEIPGSQVLLSNRTGRTYAEIVAAVDNSIEEPEAIALAEYVAPFWDYLHFVYDTEGPEIILWTYGSSITTSDFAKSLTHIKMELEAAGYPFSDWNSGIYEAALQQYGELIVYAITNDAPYYAKLFSQVAVDATIILY